MNDPKRYVFDKETGLSKPGGLKFVLEAMARSLKVGRGPFFVTRAGDYHHPNLSRSRAMIVTREILKSIPVKSGVVIRDVAGDVVFHAKRVGIDPYDDPFRDARIFPNRINGGVDYCGAGPVYALGNAVIVNVGTPSNTTVFGNDLSVYQLLDGPAKGKFVFFAEHYYVEPGHGVGARVDSKTVLYHMTDCIEIGWSDGRGSMAWDIAPNSIEGQRTIWGQNFSDLLEAVGTPPGLTTGRLLTMRLPADWPTDWSEV